MGYFPSYTGNIQEIDLSGAAAGLGEKWSMLDEADSKQNWRPGGAWLAATDSTRRLYVMMHENGGEGSHDNPGSEIWVFDTASKTRVKPHTPGAACHRVRYHHGRCTENRDHQY